MRRTVKQSIVAALAAATAVAGVLALPASAATPAPPRLGVLAQPAGVEGCVQDPSVPAESCDAGHALTDVGPEALTPDGTLLFVAGSNSTEGDTIAIFSRDTRTGRVTQAAGAAGCASLNGLGCAKIALLSGITSLAATDTALYVGLGSGRILALNIGGGGALSRASTPDGCALDTTAGTPARDCQPASGIPRPSALAISGDGSALYVVSTAGGAAGATGSFATFDISYDPNLGHNTMTYHSCYASGLAAGPPPPATTCTPTNGLDNARAVAVSHAPNDSSAFVAGGGSASAAVVEFSGAGSGAAPVRCFGTTSGCGAPAGTPAARITGVPSDVVVSSDGKQVYVTTQRFGTTATDDNFNGGGLIRIDRAADVLTQPGDTTGCIQQPAVAGCATGRGLVGAGSLVASPDGAQVYTAASLVRAGAKTTTASGSSAIAMFDRASNGTLTQPAGAEGCLAGAALAGDGCAVGHGLKGPGRTSDSLLISGPGGQLYAAADQSRALAEITRHQVDLRMSSVVDPGPYVVGQGYNITLSLLNAGPADANNVLVSDIVSLGGAVVSATTTQGSCSLTPNICSLGLMKPDGTATVVFRVSPNRSATITSTALATADEGDILPGDNTTVTSLTTGTPVLSLVSGGGQAAKTSTPFLAPIKVALKDNAGAPLRGIKVTFTAPAAGASATFSGAGAETVTTDANGVATSSIPVANANLGNYTISVTSAGAATLAVALQNNDTGPSPSPTATPTATISPTPGGRTHMLLQLTSPDTITPGTASTMTANGSPNQSVTLRCYSRTPQNSQPGGAQPPYFDARKDVTSSSGVVSFKLSPGTNTRCFARYTDVADSDTTASNTLVQKVASALSLSAYRDGVRKYHFQGTILPHRSGQLITLYRLDGTGREIRTATTVTDASGIWRINRTFSGSGQFTFRARTGQTLTNVAGVSNSRLTIIH